MIRTRLSIPTFRLRTIGVQPYNPWVKSVKQGDIVIGKTGREGQFVASRNDNPVIAWKHNPESFRDLVERFPVG